jgi:hypothetical protein
VKIKYKTVALKQSWFLFEYPKCCIFLLTIKQNKIVFFFVTKKYIHNNIQNICMFKICIFPKKYNKNTKQCKKCSKHWYRNAPDSYLNTSKYYDSQNHYKNQFEMSWKTRCLFRWALTKNDLKLLKSCQINLQRWSHSQIESTKAIIRSKQATATFEPSWLRMGYPTSWYCLPGFHRAWTDYSKIIKHRDFFWQKFLKLFFE